MVKSKFYTKFVLFKFACFTLIDLRVMIRMTNLQNMNSWYCILNYIQTLKNIAMHIELFLFLKGIGTLEN